MLIIPTATVEGVFISHDLDQWTNFYSKSNQVDIRKIFKPLKVPPTSMLIDILEIAELCNANLPPKSRHKKWLRDLKLSRSYELKRFK
jgi:hypothetical protein